MDIKKLRLRLKLAQEDFARLIGVNQATVSKWERGDIGISRLALRSIEQLKQQDPRWLKQEAVRLRREALRLKLEAA